MEEKNNYKVKIKRVQKLIFVEVILLVSIVGTLVLKIYDSSNNLNTSGDWGAELATFNVKFEDYEGSSVMGSRVNALLSVVATNNATQGENGKQVELEVLATNWNGTAPEGIITKMDRENRAMTGKSYAVKCSYASNGLVNKITIRDSTANTQNIQNTQNINSSTN